MGKKNISIDYGKVSKETKKLKKEADAELKDYIKEKYDPMILEMQECKGTYANAMVRELRLEKNTVQETAKLLKKIQNMINETAKAFKKTDESYKKAKL